MQQSTCSSLRTAGRSSEHARCCTACHMRRHGLDCACIAIRTDTRHAARRVVLSARTQHYQEHSPASRATALLFCFLTQKASISHLRREVDRGQHLDACFVWLPLSADLCGAASAWWRCCAAARRSSSTGSPSPARHLRLQRACRGWTSTGAGCALAGPVPGSGSACQVKQRKRIFHVRAGKVGTVSSGSQLGITGNHRDYLVTAIAWLRRNLAIRGWSVIAAQASFAGERKPARLLSSATSPCAAEQAPDKGLVAPDVVLFLAMDPAAAASRGGYGGERYEKLAFQKQVPLQQSASHRLSCNFRPSNKEE